MPVGRLINVKILEVVDDATYRALEMTLRVITAKTPESTACTSQPRAR